jgi:hypothetical protein
MFRDQVFLKNPRLGANKRRRHGQTPNGIQEFNLHDTFRVEVSRAEARIWGTALALSVGRSCLPSNSRRSRARVSCPKIVTSSSDAMVGMAMRPAANANAGTKVSNANPRAMTPRLCCNLRSSRSLALATAPKTLGGVRQENRYHCARTHEQKRDGDERVRDGFESTIISPPRGDQTHGCDADCKGQRPLVAPKCVKIGRYRNGWDCNQRRPRDERAGCACAAT